MTKAPDSPQSPPDPEVEALLDFPPVVRKCVRHDGWLPERQREFIRALVMLGSAEQAAIAVGGTMSGAYKLRKAEGGERFAACWDSALALHLRRYPKPEPKGRPSRGEIQSGVGRKPWPARPAAPPPVPEAEERAAEEALDEILIKYLMKLQAEREARLAGRIVEADYYVRQLSWLEVVLDLGGRGPDLLKRLKRGDLHPGEIVATPMSLVLGQIRCGYWAMMGEPERPSPPELGIHDDELATGPPLERQRSDPTLTDSEWLRQCEEREAVAAEAQRLWEEKARAEAAAWAEREAEKDRGADSIDKEEEEEEEEEEE